MFRFCILAQNYVNMRVHKLCKIWLEQCVVKTQVKRILLCYIMSPKLIRYRTLNA